MTDFEIKLLNCDKAIKLNPKDPSGYYNRGLVKYEMQNYLGADSDFSQAIKLNPKDFECYYLRGNSKNSVKDYPAAILDYDNAIKINPNFAEAYYMRGKAQKMLQKYHDSIADFNKAIELDAEYAYAYNNRGEAKYALQDYEGALKDFYKAIELYPDNAQFCNNLDVAEEDYYTVNDTPYEKYDDDHDYDSKSTKSLDHKISSNLEYKANFEIALNVIYKHPDESIGLSFKIINFPGIDSGYLYWLEVWQLNQQTFGRWPLITNNYQNFLPEAIDIRNVNSWFAVVINGESIPLLLSRTESSILGRWEQPVDTNVNKPLKF